MGTYKQKTCPTCGVTHKKRGPYCSRSCGNHRTFTEADRKARSDKLKQYLDSPEGLEKRESAKDALALANIKNKNTHDPDAAELTMDDIFLKPMVRELPDGKFVQDGDLWTEDNW